MSEGKAIYAALQAVQRELKAPKSQTNKFGGYKYRSCEDIVEAVKPLLNDNGLILTMSDEIVNVADRVYVKATCRVTDVATGDCIETTAMARESSQKKGMDDSQITGTASSYARKYGLNGLFAIDDTKDADTNEYHQTSQNRPQATQKAKPTTSTKAPAKAAQNANDEVRAKAMQDLTKEMHRIGCTGDETKALAAVHFGKTSTKEMTTNEICQLAINLESWVMEEVQGVDDGK
jgi:hypothetical protein